MEIIFWESEDFLSKISMSSDRNNYFVDKSAVNKSLHIINVMACALFMSR